MPIRAAQPRKVSRREYWRRKLNAAETPSGRLQEACDYLRAMAASYPDQRHAESEMKRLADDLEAAAKELGRKVR